MRAFSRAFLVQSVKSSALNVTSFRRIFLAKVKGEKTVDVTRKSAMAWSKISCTFYVGLAYNTEGW